MIRTPSIVVLLLVLVITVSSFIAKQSLKGAWEYAGGIYNGKKEGAPTDYKLQRRYDKVHFESFSIDSGAAPVKYEAGDYELRGDTCIETQTYSGPPSKVLNIAIPYLYSIRNDTLTLKATLPGGMVIEEYWRRKK
jgi:hypothetical protein